MRHISFDESTVMNELVKIASAKQLIQTTKKLATDSVTEMDAVDSIKNRLDSMFNAKNISKEERKVLLQDTQKLLKDLHDFESGTQAKPSFDIVDEENKNQIYNEHKKNKSNKAQLTESQGYCPWCESGDVGQGIVACPECEANMNKTAAKNDVYDVSGETAENLVEDAHGKKGTETELTNKPKDDGALVENIVEQHKKDVEIVEKDPTGAYASLMILKSKFNDLGLSKYASKLDIIINDLIPQEMVIATKLLSLANKLSSMGYTKQAQEVALILKKKVVKTAAPGDTLRETSVLAAIQLINFLSNSLSAHYKPVVDALKSLQNEGWGKVLAEAKRLSQNDPKIQTALRNAFQDKTVMTAVNNYAAARKGDMRAQEGLQPHQNVVPNQQQSTLASTKIAVLLNPKDAEKEFNATSIKLANFLVNYLSAKGAPIIRPLVSKLATLTNKGWFVTLNEAHRLAEANDDLNKVLNDFLALEKVQQLVLLLNDYKKDMVGETKVEIGPIGVETKRVNKYNPKVKLFQQTWNKFVAEPFKPSAVLDVDGLYGPKTRAAVNEVGEMSVEAIKEYAKNLTNLDNETKNMSKLKSQPLAIDPAVREKFGDYMHNATTKAFDYFKLDRSKLNTDQMSQIRDILRNIVVEALKQSVGNPNPDQFIENYINTNIPKMQSSLTAFKQ